MRRARGEAPVNQHKHIRIAVGSRAHSNLKPSNLDEFLTEAARRGAKVLGFEMRGDVWDVKAMVTK